MAGAALSAQATLTAGAGTEDVLWTAYALATQVAQASEVKWREVVMAGGRSYRMGDLYRQAYIDRIAASNAYYAWITARKR